MRKIISTVIVAANLISGCHNVVKHEGKKEDVVVAHMDTTVSPGEDFFSYANGGWIKKNPIPGDETSWGIGELVQKELHMRLRKVNEDALKQNARKGNTQQIGDFWYSAMDSVSAEKNGFTPLNPELQKIAGISTYEGLVTQMAAMHRYGVNVFFDDGVEQDPMHSDVYAYALNQGGLGLPNRDYYFNTDVRTTKIRDAYPGFITKIFRLMNVDSAQARAKAEQVMAFETSLAKSSRKLEDLRDPYANYHKIAISNLESISPWLNLASFLEQIGVKHVDSVIVGQPEFFKTLDDVIRTTDVETLKDYMTFHLITSFAPYLSKPFVDANFNFYSKMIRGAEQQRPRWRRALDAEEGAIGEALGQLFVKEYFNAKAKARYEQMVENVRNAYKARIEKLDWMSDSTKQKALHKLMAIRKKVGFPDKWKDFSALKVDRGPYSMNMLRANQWWTNYYLDKLGKPVDRDEWSMTPQTYNAYYNESNNEIVLPAAMMTIPGYRDEEIDDAVVYGYTGASTVGHEITHGFDDQGRKFDELGNLYNWWTSHDTAQFGKRAEVLVQQFNKMTPIDTLHINGRQTLGENLADLGGILIGLDAFKQTETYKNGKKINGLTPLQRFFLGYSLGWMMQLRQERVADMLVTDVHAPAKYRVNGPFPNVPEFYEAFHIKPTDKLYIPDSARVHLW